MAGLSVNGVSGDGYAKPKNVQAKEAKPNNDLMFLEYQKKNAEASKADVDVAGLGDGTKSEPLSKADQAMLESNKGYLGALDQARNSDATQKAQQQEVDLIKFMKHLSPETKAYLEKDPQFQAAEQSIQEAIKQRNEHKATIPDLKQKCIDAEKEYKALVKAGDFDAAMKAEEEYFKAQNDYQSAVIVVEFMDGQIDKTAQNAFAYATTIERWEDGKVVNYSRETVGFPGQDNVYNKEFKMVTLENGQKAYESEGKFYQIADNGLPNPYLEIGE